MPHELTHASFFSGVGGLDLGLERAGWRTVSFSEIDPYASAVLAERWSGVPNLGDITELARSERVGAGGDVEGIRPRLAGAALDDQRGLGRWHDATLWTGGFPCQDLSVAGKRRGMGTENERTRSGLAYAFLDLVERHRPPAILLENVPGLLSSNGGKDLGALLGRLGELGYWWAYRILDAQFFGVPQRRRRVFICALHAGAGFGADSAAAVLSVGTRCGGHSAESDTEGQGASGVLADGARSTRTVQSAFGHHGWTLGAQDVDGGYLQVGPLTTGTGALRGDVAEGGQYAVECSTPHPGGVREADGLAGRLDDLEQVGPILSGSGGNRTTDLNLPLTLRGGAASSDSDRLLPLGLDSHRYRCCGNGVVSNVSEWIGHRLRVAVEGSEVKAA